MKISLADLVSAVTGGIKLPTGESGDLAISVDQIKAYVSPADASTIDLSATPVVLNMNNESQKRLKSSNNFGADKAVNITNDAPTRELLVWRFPVDLAGRILTFEADVFMPDWDGNWTNGSKTWSAPKAGNFEMRGTNDGTAWNLRIEGPF